MNLLRNLCLAGIASLLSFSSSAQCDPTTPPDSVRLVTNKPISATAQSGSTLYMAGDFTVVGNFTGSCIAVDINTARPVFANWPLVRGKVNKIIPDNNGGWYVGGEFLKIGDSMRNNIAQIDANGNVTAWNAQMVMNGSNSDGWVNELYIHDSILYVGGRFFSFLGDTASHLAAVNINTGQLAAQQWQMHGYVDEITVHNNTLYLGGTFLKVNDSIRYHLAAIDLATGQVLPWNPDVAQQGANVKDIVFVNDRIFVAGSFSTISGLSRPGLAELDPVTGYPVNWIPPIALRNTRLQERNGDLYLSGGLDSAQSYTLPMLFRIDTSATPAADTLVKIGTGSFPGVPTMQRYIYDFELMGDTVFICGNFSAAQGRVRTGLLAWDLAGDSLCTWTCHAGTDYIQEGVLDLHLQNDKLFVCGDYVNIGKFSNGLAAIDMNADTVLGWTASVTFDNTFNNYGGRWIHHMLIDGNKLYVVGRFDSVSSVSRKSAAALDRFTGAVLPWSPQVTGYHGAVNKIAISGNSIYMAGAYSTINGLSRKSLAAVDTITGQVTRSWNPHTFADPQNTLFNSIVAYDTSIIVGGSFYDIANVQRHNIVKLGRESGVADAGWHPAIQGFQYTYPVNKISSMAIDGPYLYIAGHFDWVDSQYCRGIARLRLSDGALSPWAGAQHFGNNSYMGNATLSLVGNSLYVGTDSLHVIDKAEGSEHFSTTFYSPNNGARKFGNINSYNGKIYVSGNFTNMVQTYANYNKPTMHHFNWFTIPTTLPSVSISGSNLICENTWVTYGATTNVTSPSYQWQVNGSNVNSTTSQLIYQPQQNDVVSCLVTDPTPSCFTSSVVADDMHMDVVPANTTPTANIIGPDTLCASGYTSYVLNTNVIGGSYQWYLNGSPSGTNSLYYTPYVQDGDMLQCFVTAPPLNCYTASTAADAINIDTVPTIIPTITIDAGTYVTQGSVVWVDATVTNVTNGYTIRWFIDGVLHADVANSTATSYIKGPGIDTVVAVIIPFGHCIETDTSNIRIINVTGIEEVETKNGITAYPNPCTDELTLAGLKPNDNITLFDLTGRKMKQWIATQEKQLLPMTDLPPGNYILHIRSSEGEIRTSELIQKK